MGVVGLISADSAVPAQILNINLCRSLKESSKQPFCCLFSVQWLPTERGMPETTSALFNQPMKRTVSNEAAPPIMKMRQRLYDNETMMVPNEPWNPAARLAQMRDSYDRLVLELGVSPRGSGGPGSRLPRVPESRMWENGRRRNGAPRSGSTGSSAQVSTPAARTFPHETSCSAGAPPFRSDQVTPTSPAPRCQVVATARLLQRVDEMTAEGKLSAAEGERLRKLWLLQEAMLAAGPVDDDGALLSNFQQILAVIESPAAPEQPPPEQLAAAMDEAAAEVTAAAPAADDAASGAAPAEAPPPTTAAAAPASAPPEPTPAPATPAASGRAVAAVSADPPVWPKVVALVRKSGSKVRRLEFDGYSPPQES